MKIHFKRFYLKSVFIIFLFFIYIFVCACSYVNAVSSSISNSVFRLHVIANSDSNIDQNLKYLVRDALLEYMNTICENCSSKRDALQIVNSNLDEFYRIARNVIIQNGFDYDVNINVGNFDFPTKSYGNISLPAGFYDALRVEIGETQGQNWWCVMFPPLCFVDINSGVIVEDSKEFMRSNLSDEEFAIISENNSSSEVSFKFKLIEVLQNFRIFTAKNL